MVSVVVICVSLWCYVMVRRHTSFSVSYQVIGIIMFSNLAFLGNQLFIRYAKPTETALAIEAVFVFFCNIQCIVDILFVRKQWITTRK